MFCSIKNIISMASIMRGMYDCAKNAPYYISNVVHLDLLWLGLIISLL